MNRTRPTGHNSYYAKHFNTILHTLFHNLVVLFILILMHPCLLLSWCQYHYYLSHWFILREVS